MDSVPPAHAQWLLHSKQKQFSNSDDNWKGRHSGLVLFLVSSNIVCPKFLNNFFYFSTHFKASTKKKESNKHMILTCSWPQRLKNEMLKPYSMNSKFPVTFLLSFSGFFFNSLEFLGIYKVRLNKFLVLPIFLALTRWNRDAVYYGMPLV